ncbi:MAG: hypothetical protein A3E78_09885 [Alphaproteobacteria bacterium RIFCSPHIGHO2_12_FULL_63_12]|nr:MAG: hypothetical protein A3E78_09885 [Alphaproteobacteria bacterium RIFCSPHIGHO2_12_FULL_63_12]
MRRRARSRNAERAIASYRWASISSSRSGASQRHIASFKSTSFKVAAGVAAAFAMMIVCISITQSARTSSSAPPLDRLYSSRFLSQALKVLNSSSSRDARPSPIGATPENNSSISLCNSVIFIS